MDQRARSRGQERSLAHYIAILRRSWVLVLLPALAAGLFALTMASREERVYESSVTVRVSEPGNLAGDGRSTAAIDQELATSIELLRSRPVREQVLEAADPAVAAAYRTFDARRVEKTTLVRLEVRAASAEAAAALAQLWGDTFAEQARLSGRGGLVERAEELQDEADALQERIEQLDAHIATLTPRSGAAASPELTRALTERQSLFEEQAEYRRRAIEFEIEAELRENGVAVVVPAQVPEGPAAPRPLRAGVAAGVLGLLAGIGLAVVREELDTRIRDRQDLRDSLPEVPILAAIPTAKRFPQWRRHASRGLRLDYPAVEAFRALATNLELMRITSPPDGRPGGGGRVLVFTSPKAGAGKTTTVANLAASLAAIGRQVVMVNADLRDGDLHLVFGAASSPGITDIVLDELEPSSALQMVRTGEGADLTLLASGRRSRDPVQVLSSSRFVNVVSDVATLVDYVLVDAPPVLPVTDTLTLSRVADAAILVVASGKNDREQARSSIESLRQVGLDVTGTVLTGVHSAEASYGYWVGADEAPEHPDDEPTTVDIPPDAAELTAADHGREQPGT